MLPFEDQKNHAGKGSPVAVKRDPVCSYCVLQQPFCARAFTANNPSKGKEVGEGNVCGRLAC